jgi:hypothetical protein
MEGFSFAETAIELCDGRPADVEQQGIRFGGGRYCPWSTRMVDIAAQWARASTRTSLCKALQGSDPPECRHSNRVERRTLTRRVLCPVEFDRRAAC